ncbi:MFS transporter [Pyxidicoccus trucidator]|uniref:MFS transporter n=1 Tax=Pyxidicoccus trucidator TaxID=2709662 RepID=UPI0019680E31|nr:MFS transporter [Pyxidicoccus trucidator]
MIVLLGQLVSHLGSAFTQFSLSVWIYQQTGSTTSSALILLSGALPEILLTPFAGSLADRCNRRLILMWSSLGAAACVLVLAWVLYTRPSEMLYVYLAVAGSALFATLQPPAFVGSVASMIPSRQLGRANSLIMLGTAGAPILAPFFAGHLLGSIGLSGVVLLDLLSFLVAAACFFCVRFGQVTPAPGSSFRPGVMLADLRLGMRYVVARPGLLWLLLFSMVLNFNTGMVQALITPVVLSFTTAAVLGQVMSLGGIGALVGGVVMSVWGGPNRRIRGVLVFSLLQAVALCASGLRPSVPLITASAFIFLMLFTALAATYHALWQIKVGTEIQGRVFAVRTLVGLAFTPLAYGIAGPLADHVFEPLLMPDGALASSVGAVIGVGPGRGAAFLLSLVGLLAGLVALIGLVQPRLRRLEDDLPDVEQQPGAAHGSTP